MASRVAELVIDCADPRGLAEFWCSVLDYEVLDEEADGFISIGPATALEGGQRPSPLPPTLEFALVPEAKTVKNRLHIDLVATDRDQAAEVRRVVELGARHVDVGQGDQSWVVLADPEGNEFCVLGERRP